jgi:glucose/arabinose dehydrogenase
MRLANDAFMTRLRRPLRDSLPVTFALLAASACQTSKLGGYDVGDPQLAEPAVPRSSNDAASDAGASDGGTNQLLPHVALPQVHEGFTLNVFASDLGDTGVLSTHGEHVYLTRPEQGDVVRLVDDDRDGVAESFVTELSNLTGVHGMAFHESTVYLATPNSVYSTSVAGDGSFGYPCGIMGELPDGGDHPLRTLGIGPDEKLYVSVASECDACEQTNPERATILRTELDGSGRAVFARGMQQTIGFGWHPVTHALWGRDKGADWLGIAFYRGDSFAESYTNDAFVAVRGDTLGRLRFDKDGNAMALEDFVTGIAIENGAGITVAPDGALLFTDDASCDVYRVQADE